MKRIFLVTLILLLTSTALFAQMGQTSAQVRQNAQSYATQARANANQFEQVLNDLRARNVANADAAIFNRMRNEINRLESQIETEEHRITATLDRGNLVNPEVLERVARLISQHRNKVTELENFIAN
ncbi:MAG: hypothetical protein FWH12_00425 [Treponema sp.]|nr:hypothetical protein [Treponema sp.]